MLDFVRSIKEYGMKFAIATNSTKERAYSIVHDILGLTPYVDAICTIEDVARPKPYPDLYNLAAVRLGVLPGNCAGFEDVVEGFTAVSRAKMKVVQVRQFYRDVTPNYVDYIAKSYYGLTPERIVDIIEKKNGLGGTFEQHGHIPFANSQ